jgi:hypothetical protein
MVAPHLSGQLTMQSDLGHPADVVVGVVGDYRFGLFPKIWLVARGLVICMRGAAVECLCLQWQGLTEEADDAKGRRQMV